MAYSVRAGAVEDVPEICRQRRRMFEEMGHTDAQALEVMAERFSAWVKRLLSRNEYFAWLAFEGEKCVAGAGLWLIDWPSHILDPLHPRGYILNVYTEPDHRRKGLARLLTERCVAHCEEQDIQIISLHASEQGRVVYESLGFVASNEMVRGHSLGDTVVRCQATKSGK